MLDLGFFRWAGLWLLTTWLVFGSLPHLPASIEGSAPAFRAVGTGLERDTAPVVYLTFDDGPHPVYTPKVLDVLAQYDVRATFFVVGKMVSWFPEVTRRIVSEGHSIQLHSWNHDNLTRLSHEDFGKDSNRTQAVLGKTVGMRATCLRPPYGAINAQVREWASEINLEVSLWDVAGSDWTDISAEEIARSVMRGVRSGTVVLLHDGGGHRQRTVAALEMILPDLIGEGYRFELMCSSLYLPEPSPPCWVYHAWPKPGPCVVTS